MAVKSVIWVCPKQRIRVVGDSLSEVNTFQLHISCALFYCSFVIVLTRTMHLHMLLTCLPSLKQRSLEEGVGSGVQVSWRDLSHCLHPFLQHLGR